MRVPTAQRRRRGFRVRGWIIAAVILLVILLFSLRGLAGFYTDFLWFDSVGQGDTWRSLISAHVVPALAQEASQGGDDVGQTAGLGEGRALRGDEAELEGTHGGPV